MLFFVSAAVVESEKSQNMNVNQQDMHKVWKNKLKLNIIVTC